MYRLIIPDGARHCDGLTRREVLRIGGLTLGGLTLPTLLLARTKAEASLIPKARSVVILYLIGRTSAA